ncbi:unnamed protein product [Heligmosomoides polygyrus]|uniref:Ig-like domain-containing protein n=1 Tax=Heligmosomoides polygyrus TaxID=6339 RepID=A0A183G5P8_HELPZ|nr:unnamed protein product [Heligmosomoides polygyrus]
MHNESPDSSFTWSDYSISEDDAYIYCRVGNNTASKAAPDTTPKPTLERWRSCRDSGFVEHMQLPQTVDDVAAGNLEQTTADVDDHEYYNLLPFQKAAKTVEHDYTYPAFTIDEDVENHCDVRRVKVGGASLRNARRKLRRIDSDLSTLSHRTVINAARPYRGAREEPTTPHVRATFKKTTTQRRLCCVQCREEEMTKQERCTETRHACGSNFSNEAIELYGRLIIVALEELRAEPQGADRIAALQRKIERILRLRTGLNLSVEFDKSAALFGESTRRRRRRWWAWWDERLKH